MSYGNVSHTVDFDGSYIYLLDKSTWWVPSAIPIAQWKNLSAIFMPSLWLAILIIFLTNGITLWLFRQKEDTDYDDIIICIMRSLSTLLQGSVTEPKSWRIRMIFIIWLFSCLLLFSAHQSSLVSIK